MKAQQLTPDKMDVTEKGSEFYSISLASAVILTPASEKKYAEYELNIARPTNCCKT